MALDQLGVPKSVAMRLTVPERVTSFNKKRMQAIVRRDPEELGSALYVERNSDGERIDLSYINRSHAALQLGVGDVVERQLQDNDVVAFNRQPSLHKMSIMAMRVKIMPAGSVFKINLAATTPFNAGKSPPRGEEPLVY